MRLSRIYPVAITLAFIIVGLMGPHSSMADPASSLVHRWSFTMDASDSVGGADGTLVGGASVSGGAVVLDGLNDYVSLPIGSTIGGLTNSTFEAWITWDTFVAWARVFDFGNNTSEYMFLTPRNGRLDAGPVVNTPRFAITSGSNPGEQQATSASAFPIGTETHVAVTIDADTDTGRLYVDGSLVATNSGMTLTPSSLGNTTNNWLGRSQWSPDPFFDGSISEFRIYNEALSPTEIAAGFGAGPATVIPASGAAMLALIGFSVAPLLRRHFDKA